MAIIKVVGYQCDRCGHEWSPRLKTDVEPAICPKCKSAYWNKPRRIDMAKNEVEQARQAMKNKKKRRDADL
ncbi:MAG: hypothetical protein KGH86_05375 [Thaumarchaeota archaeon]|nr:hypothetical protein [Nitrososphaerota archaeon]